MTISFYKKHNQIYKWILDDKEKIFDKILKYDANFNSFNYFFAINCFPTHQTMINAIKLENYMFVESFYNLISWDNKFYYEAVKLKHSTMLIHLQCRYKKPFPEDLIYYSAHC